MTAVSFVWERGGKISYTNLEPVGAADRKARFHHYLQQTATIYKDGHMFQPKEWSFKMQVTLRRKHDMYTRIHGLS